MTRIFVTGAAGQLGQLVLKALLETEQPKTLIAGVRNLDAPMAEKIRAGGIETRIADYTHPETLTAAFQGVDRLLLISSSENGQRIGQHRNVITAARSAGVGLIAYTSILRADTSPLLPAVEHRDTEAALAESDLPYVLLRNGWYTEVYTWRLPMALKAGKLIGAAGEGRISAAARADYARAAATVLATDGHAGKTYELAGDTAFTLTDLAQIVAEASGQPFDYVNLSPEVFKDMAAKAGVPEMVGTFLANVDAGTAEGALFDEDHVLSRLIGRPTTPFADTIRHFVQAGAAKNIAPH